MRKNTPSLGIAVHDLGQLLVIPQSTAGVKNFAKLGVDINALKDRTLKAGGDPIQMLLETLDRVTDHTRNNVAMQTLFHNVQDRAAAAAILQHWHGDPAKGDLGYTDVQEKLRNATPADTNADYATGLTSPKIRLQAFEESLSQLNRRIGTGFQPTLDRMTAALNLLNEKWEWLDVHVPGLTSAFTGFAGTTLGLTAAIAALRAVSSPLIAALRLLASPLRAVLSLSRGLSVAMGLGRIATIAMGGAFVAIAAVAVAAIGDIALHWDRFSGMFHALGHGVLEEWRGLGNFIAGVFTGNWDRALHGLGQSFRGFSTALGGEFGIFRQLFLDFAHWLDGWTGGLPSRILSGITAEWHVLTDGLTNKLHDLEGAFDHSWLGQHMGFAAPVPAAAVAVPVAGAHNAAGRAQQVNLHVTADRGLQVRQTGGPTHGVTIAQPNTGRMVGRP
ncbi:MAG: hypothetical protein ABF479_20710 [Gluconacetobacter sp.]|uniref:Phage tail tape measure protein n=1 Tax=Gluconacetobacter dulcium TaxID=2729096 RepID=A0A7W4PGL0_9PROT|nr:hypothetical protein [Gluconacetobacter dulcium]MBB2197302.1 hypothetical protein [Gluconacetobacter dulcium]